jgi:hypothetical protein
MDLPTTLAGLTGQAIPVGSARDSVNILPALLGDSAIGRKLLVEHDGFEVLGLRDDTWKFIAPDERPRGEYSSTGELYDLAVDLGETNDLAGTRTNEWKRMGGELNGWKTQVASAKNPPPAP